MRSLQTGHKLCHYTVYTDVLPSKQEGTEEEIVTGVKLLDGIVVGVIMKSKNAEFVIHATCGKVTQK